MTLHCSRIKHLLPYRNDLAAFEPGALSPFRRVDAREACAFNRDDSRDVTNSRNLREIGAVAGFDTINRRGNPRSIWRHRDGRLTAPSYVALTLALAVLAGIGVALTVALRPSTASAVPEASYTPRATYSFTTEGPVQVSFAAVGDSVTNDDSVDFAAGNTDSLSWATYARSSTRLFAEGFASGGADTASCRRWA
jgi:hypothetical protein